MIVANPFMPMAHRRWWGVAACVVIAPVLLVVAPPRGAAAADKPKESAPVVHKSAHPGVGEMVVVPASRRSMLRATVGPNGKVTFDRRQVQAAADDAATGR